MAKALFGHVGSAADQRLRDEVQRLTMTVQYLELEVNRLRSDNADMAIRLSDYEHDLRRLVLDESVLT